MASRLGPIVAERTLERAGSSRPVLARLGRPRRSRRWGWECPYQILGVDDSRVRVAPGEDALQTVVLACAGLRAQLTEVGASWLGMGASGIPPFIPDIFGTKFTAHLEAVVEKEIVKLTARLKRAHERRATRIGTEPPNRRVKPAAGGARRLIHGSGRRGLRTGR
jgi:hypothetical protein